MIENYDFDQYIRSYDQYINTVKQFIAHPEYFLNYRRLETCWDSTNKIYQSKLNYYGLAFLCFPDATDTYDLGVTHKSSCIGWKLGSKYSSCQCNTMRLRFIKALTSIANKLEEDSVIIRHVNYLDWGQNSACVKYYIIKITL